MEAGVVLASQLLKRITCFQCVFSVATETDHGYRLGRLRAPLDRTPPAVVPQPLPVDVPPRLQPRPVDVPPLPQLQPHVVPPQLQPTNAPKEGEEDQKKGKEEEGEGQWRGGKTKEGEGEEEDQKEEGGDTGGGKGKGKGGPQRGAEEGGNAGGPVGGQEQEGRVASGGGAKGQGEGVGGKDGGKGGKGQGEGRAGKGGKDGGNGGTVGKGDNVGSVDVADEALRNISKVIADVAIGVELSQDAKSATAPKLQGSGRFQLQFALKMSDTVRQAMSFLTTSIGPAAGMHVLCRMSLAA